MKILTTDYQQGFSSEPTRLEVLREIEKRRGLDAHEKLQKEWWLLQKGEEGEEILLDYIKRYGRDHWTVLRNVWLETFSEFECDVFLVTTAGVYGFEVKNYSRKIEIRNNSCWMLGKEMTRNPVLQTKNMTNNLREIFNELPNPPHFKGALALVGADSKVDIQEPVNEIKVLPLDEIRDYIWSIAEEEDRHLGYPIDMDLIFRKLGEYEKNSSFVAEELPGVTEPDIRRGICCGYCGDFDLNTSGNYLECACGFHESREEAIVRTICEYGVIHNERNFTTTELAEFFGGELSDRTIQRYLNKHFEKIGTYKDAEYVNKKLPFEQIRNGFVFKDQRYLLF